MQKLISNVQKGFQLKLNQNRVFKSFFGQREKILDITRAAAVLLMIITHVIAITFDHADSSSRLVYYVGIFGGIASFTTFLLLSGSTNYISFVHIEKEESKLITRKKLGIFKRSFVFLLAYYFLATLALYLTRAAFVSNINEELIKDFVRVVFFLRVPEFTEFLITLIFFAFSLIIFKRFYKKVVSNKWNLIVVSILSYVAGYTLYSVDLGHDRLNLIKALFSGHQTLHTFPILQYLPIFLLGMYIGRIFLTTEEKKVRVQRLVIILLSVVCLTFVNFIVYSQTEVHFANLSFYDSRFPPTVGFLVLSTAIALGFLLFSTLSSDRLLNRLDKIYMFISKNAFSFFVIHTIILLVFRYIQNLRFENQEWQYSRLYEIASVYIVVLVLCTVLIMLKNKLAAIYDYIDEQTGTHNYLVNRVLPFIVLLSIVILIGFTIRDNHLLRTTQISYSTNQIQRTFTVEDNFEQWYDHNFQYYQPIHLASLTSDQIFISKNWAFVQFDHRDVVRNSKLRHSKGEDIRIVEFNGIDFEEVPIIVQDPNTTSTKVLFNFQANPNSKYYLYYGNNSSKLAVAPADQSGADSAIEVTMGARVEHIIKANLNRRWFLKDYAPGSNFDFRVTVPEQISNIQYVTYAIDGSDINGVMLNTNGSNFESKVDITSLEPGYYSIQANVVEVSDQLNIYKSFKVPFYVSYPIYMSWTLDWEGWGVANYELNDIVSIADTYKMPITHFFNPRIYIEKQESIHKVDPAAARFFTNWVIDRRSKGDEIALHLHFYPDLLNEIGIEVRDDAKLIGIGRDETYIHGYSYDELDEIFRWSIEKFEENGLGRPISFRSGAWMSSTVVLQALANNGILLDSSGRTSGILNPAWSGSTPIPWNLEPTVKPYKPSVNNINSWQGERIDIWQFPNNGADSYWFNAQDLKARFDMNYSKRNSVLDRPQSLVYLSHPHGFTVYDSPKIRELLDYTNSFLFTSDNGPLVYATLENIYHNWNKEKYFNGD